MTEFDKTSVYENELREKILEIVQICNRERMPVFIAVCTKNDNKGTTYEKEMYATVSNDIHLKEDILPNLVNVTNGFRTAPPIEIIELDFD